MLLTELVQLLSCVIVWLLSSNIQVMSISGVISRRVGFRIIFESDISQVIKLNRSRSTIHELREVPLTAPRPPLPRSIRCTRTRLVVQSVAVSVDQVLKKSLYNYCSVNLTSSKRNYSSTVLKPKMPTGKPFQRLPETVRPKHYALSLVPDLKALVFEGDVSVQIEVGSRPSAHSTNKTYAGCFRTTHITQSKLNK